MNLITIALAFIIAIILTVALYIFVIKPGYITIDSGGEEPPPPPPSEEYEGGSESLPPLPE